MNLGQEIHEVDTDFVGDLGELNLFYQDVIKNIIEIRVKIFSVVGRLYRVFQKKPAPKLFCHYFLIYGWKSMKLQKYFG